MTDLALYGVAATPIIVALVEIAKSSGLPTRFAPILSLFLGVGAGVAAQYGLPHPALLQGVVTGVVVGLAASGAYSGIAKFTEPRALIAGSLEQVAPVAPATEAPAPEPAPTA